MDRASAIVVLSLDEQRYGLWLSAVERVIRLVLVTPLPKAPEIVLGVINVRGAVLPVIDLRKRFRLPPREPALSDHLVLARTARRRLALIVDNVAGVEGAGRAASLGIEGLPPRSEYVSGLVKTDDGMILIHDLDTFLALDEERLLDGALTAAGGEG